MNNGSHFLELEQKLSEDQNGEYRSKLTAALEQERHAVKRVIDGGLPPDEFQKVNSYLIAIDEAVDVVGKLIPGTR